MTDNSTKETLTEMFIFETLQLLEQLEQSMLNSEKRTDFSENTINEVFRIMHTIKGSAAVMVLENISVLAHTIEDIFYYLREEKPKDIDYSSLYDLVFESVDFINVEVNKIKAGDNPDGNVPLLISSLNNFLVHLKQNNTFHNSTSIHKENFIKQALANAVVNIQNEGSNNYFAVIHFEENCQMENVRAYMIVHKLEEIANRLYYLPQDIMTNTDSCEVIHKQGFKIYLQCDYSYEQMTDFFMQSLYLKSLELVQVNNEEEVKQLFMNYGTVLEEENPDTSSKAEVEKTESKNDDKDTVSMNRQTMISVNVAKLDKLMDLVGEMVIAESMVIQNPDLNGLELSNFRKSSIQLKKITNELQDIVMSIRMVSLSATFNKMNRIVRDMCKKLNKEVQLQIKGEETEVDKNIIEHLSDPLMHLVRNAVDHGIEAVAERIEKGKPEVGTITLEAKNSGSDVLIIVRDDGRGLDKDKILQKAREHNLISDIVDPPDKEIFQMILLPGFSTNENVTEFSGRGVGMDVVAKNIEAIRGYLSVESSKDQGTIFTMRIPLTLAIIDGMNIKVGDAHFTIPTISIKEFFRPQECDIITDPDGKEMIMIRGKCYKLVRLNDLYHISSQRKDKKEGIIIIALHAEKSICIWADELLGQQQVVIKALPDYIHKLKTIQGLAGCTLLGDGSISLTIDVAELISL